MIKLLFLTHSLGGGGAERVLVNLVNHMDRSRFDITVRTLFTDGVNRKMLDKGIRYECCHAKMVKGITYVYKLLPPRFLYRKFVGDGDYDIVVAYMHGIPTKVVSGCTNPKTKTVTWLHTGTPKTSTFFKSWLSRKKAIRGYASLDAIVGVSQDVSDAFRKYTRIENVHTVYNTNDTARILKMAEEQADLSDYQRPVIVTAGHLEPVKGNDRLIDAAKRLADDGYRFSVLIMGTGSQKEKLQQQITENHLDDCVHLLGFCENPYAIMAQSDLFVSSSRQEGLATVLTEALTVGLPVVATEVSGAKEVLGQNNEYGLVVENSESGIYEGLKAFLTHPELVQKYRESAKERSTQFDTEHTVQKTEAFFESLMTEKQ